MRRIRPFAGRSKELAHAAAALADGRGAESWTVRRGWGRAGCCGRSPSRSTAAVSGWWRCSRVRARAGFRWVRRRGCFPIPWTRPGPRVSVLRWTTSTAVPGLCARCSRWTTSSCWTAQRGAGPAHGADRAGERHRDAADRGAGAGRGHRVAEERPGGPGARRGAGPQQGVGPQRLLPARTQTTLSGQATGNPALRLSSTAGRAQSDEARQCCNYGTASDWRPNYRSWSLRPLP